MHYIIVTIRRGFSLHNKIVMCFNKHLLILFANVILQFFEMKKKRTELQTYIYVHIHLL